MDIGSAKPSPEELKKVPHHLVNIIQPNELYSVADFCRAVHFLIPEIFARGHYPLLVGGTMMYFNALYQGLDGLPSRNEKIRSELDSLLKTKGVEALYAVLEKLSPSKAEKINPTDTQRLIRSLELAYLHQLDQKKIQSVQQEGFENSDSSDNSDNSDNSELFSFISLNQNYHIRAIGLLPQDIPWQRARIQQRFDSMLSAGFLEEIQQLKVNYGLDLNDDTKKNLPAMRAVGYRQAFEYLAGRYDFNSFCERAVTATAQLAKRQRTWLRGFDWTEKLDPKSLGFSVILDCWRCFMD